MKNKRSEEGGFWNIVKEVFSIVVISLIIVIPIRYFLVQPFVVKGKSMEPNFSNQQYLVINELDYRLHFPSRLDVIVFKYPNDPSEYYIKRVIGLPGEKIEINSGQVVIYNTDHPDGQVLDESAYLPAGTVTKPDMIVQLDTDEYFVLGDNRDESSDSRFWGTLPSDLIIGKVWVRAFPFDKFALYSLEAILSADLAASK